MDAHDVRSQWLLEPAVSYLNHGAYGACPRPVLAAQAEWRDRMERQPVRFLGRDVERELDDARAALAEFIGAQADDLAFVPNATTGVNTVLRSLELTAGDELLATDHEYNACLNALADLARSSGARLVVCRVPFPLAAPGEVIEAVLAAVTPRTRLAVISHVTSPTALVWPIGQIVSALAERGVDTLVDGAHAPGMVPLALDALGAAYYAGNAHKWLCAPKGAGFLHVRRDRQSRVRPLVVSHGANSPRTDRSRFRLEFDWTGTADLSAYLSIPAAIEFGNGLLAGGWSELMATNRRLALAGRQSLLDTLAADAPAPPEMIGSVATVVLPPEIAPRPPAMPSDAPPGATYPPDQLHDLLLERFGIEVPVYAWPPTPAADRSRLRLLRLSAQVYNRPADYETLADSLALLAAQPLE